MAELNIYFYYYYYLASKRAYLHSDHKTIKYIYSSHYTDRGQSVVVGCSLSSPMFHVVDAAAAPRRKREGSFTQNCISISIQVLYLHRVERYIYLASQQYSYSTHLAHGFMYVRRYSLTHYSLPGEFLNDVVGGIAERTKISVQCRQCNENSNECKEKYYQQHNHNKISAVDGWMGGGS